MTTTTPAPGPPTMNTLSIAIDGEIGTLTLERPESLNAMSPEMIGELVLASGWLADRATLRALIVTGSGRAFSAGGDVNWFRSGLDDPELDLPSDVRRGADVLHQAIVDFRRIPYPVIGAINGVAAGAGFSLALMCDLRIASAEAAFVCAYGRIGASPDGGMTYFLPRVVGPARALELLLEDPLLSADQRWSSASYRRSSPPRSCTRRRARRPSTSPRRPRTTCGWRSSWSARASTTRSQTTCSSNGTASRTRWPPRTCARASPPSSRAARRSSPAAERPIEFGAPEERTW